MERGSAKAKSELGAEQKERASSPAAECTTRSAAKCSLLFVRGKRRPPAASNSEHCEIERVSEAAESSQQISEHSQEEEMEDKVESYWPPVEEGGGYPPKLQ